jgi:antitoxin (DNA-binding transcriptional repressor) of toxin-antitoxin stability system
MVRAVLFLPLAIAACSNPSGPIPSLAPRAAEAIDPRVPIPTAAPLGTLDPALEARLAQLLAEARAGDEAFVATAGEAERLAASADGPAGESWIAAQQALSVLVAARGRTARALSDIDAIAAQRLETARWISPVNFAAIEAAASEVGAIDRRQAALIDSLQVRLGS